MSDIETDVEIKTKDKSKKLRNEVTKSRKAGTKVKGSMFKAQSSMSPEIMNYLFLNLSLSLKSEVEVEVEIKIKDKSRSEAKTQSEAWG